jgi:hypothetical protein
MLNPVASIADLTLICLTIVSVKKCCARGRFGSRDAFYARYHVQIDLELLGRVRREGFVRVEVKCSVKQLLANTKESGVCIDHRPVGCVRQSLIRLVVKFWPR